MKTVNVLMVEDNPGDVVLVEEAIARTEVDYCITVVGDGEAVIEYLHDRGEPDGAHRPALIILDLKLPLKSGRDVLKEIRLGPQWDDVPIVVMSSSSSEMELTRQLAKAKVAYMAKPNTFSGYVEMVRSMERFRLECAG